MFKELNLEDAKNVLNDFTSCLGAFDYLKEDNDLRKYSIKGLNKAYEEYIKKCSLTKNNDINIFVNTYNNYLNFRKENKEEFLVILRKAQNLSDACNISDYFASRNNHSKLEGEWLSIKEIQDYLDKDFYVYVVRNKYFRIEHEIDKIEELMQYKVFTFKEATSIWRLGESTLRSVVRQNNLIEGVHYRKSGSNWLITEEAMIKLYGKPNVIIEDKK
ncbi:TPA: helix-turn-helix domain-containing protein [Clostridioides difficile]